MYKSIFIGFFLGAVFLLFFIGCQANAMVIDNTKEVIRDSDIIGTKVKHNEVVFSYIDEFIDNFLYDEIGTNYTRKNDQLKVYSGDNFVKSGDLWFTLNYATTTLVEFQKATQEIGKTNSRGILSYILPFANAQTSTSTVSGDGYIQYASGNWSTVRDASAGTDAYDSNSANYFNCKDNGADYILSRMYFPFYTVGLISEDYYISTSSLFFYTNTNTHGNDDDDDYWVVIETSQASPLSLVTSDYDNFTYTELSNHDDDWDNFEYKEMVLNSTGTSTISNIDYTYFGLIWGYDAENTACEFGGTISNILNIRAVEEAGTNKDPYLLINLVEESEEATSTPQASTSSVSLPCDLNNNSINSLNIISSCNETYESTSTLPTSTSYSYYYIPFIAWIIFLIPILWVLNRYLIEFIIRLRQ